MKSSRIFKNGEDIIRNGKTPEIRKAREDLLSILSHAIEKVDPYTVTSSYLDKIDLSIYDNIYLLAFGKASVRMAEAVCDRVKIREGVVITNENKMVRSGNVSTYLCDHPIPTSRNITATERALSMLRHCKENDLLLVLISGGGSALLCKPRIPLHDMQVLFDLILKSGADIMEFNTIRKHLSYVKGGQLAKLVKCDILSCIISDVVGDPIEFIASGPTAPDSTTFEDAKRILDKYLLWDKIPASARDVIEKGLRGEIPETPKPGDEVFEGVRNVIIANNKLACEGARMRAEEMGYGARIISTSLTGEAREVGRYLVKEALKKLGDREVMISGGETTVTVKGNGKGGRNQEMVLGCIEEVSSTNLVFSSMATDGIDGNSPSAGAIVDGFSLKRSQEMGLNFREYLDNNDSYGFFSKLGDALMTGSTGTNVMDIQVILRYRAT